MQFVTCPRCRGTVDLNSELRYSPNRGIDIYHVHCFVSKQADEIERLRSGIRRAASGKCHRPGCDKPVPVSPPWCSVTCMDEHVKALPPQTPGDTWTCSCGYMNTAGICTKCGRLQ